MRRAPSRPAAGEFETVIWDFNGTILDDLDLVVRSVNVQLADRNLPELSVDRYRSLFGFPVEAYYRAIGLDPGRESMADLSAEFFDLYVPGMAACALYDGVRDALKTFRSGGARQFVLSAMEEGLLKRTIDRLAISEFFDGIYGLAHQEADSKVSRGRELIDDQDIRPGAALLIGDTDHDAEVADALGMEVVLVAQGHQSEERLRATGRTVVQSVGALRIDAVSKA